jgi:hypothetical protein
MRAIKITYLQKLACCVFFFIGMITYGQKQKLSFNSFSFTTEMFFMDDFYAGGFGFTGDVSWNIEKHIFTFSAFAGAEYVIWGDADSFQQLNILYGRELKLKEWFFIDAHAGLGILFYDTYAESSATMEFPIVTKIRFKTGKKFSIGPKFQANISSNINIYSVGLLLQWNY